VILGRGLEATRASWPEIRAAFGWVRRFAAVLHNGAGLGAAGVRRRYRGLIGSLARHRGKLGSLIGAFDRFRKVTRSYWAGLFRCYEVAELPRTNNDLGQLFGSYRLDFPTDGGRWANGSIRLVRTRRVICIPATNGAGSG
jgi:hypothetical protein